ATALASFYSGRGRTSVVMVVDTAAVALNLVLDYLLIFGFSGAALGLGGVSVPALGIAGAAWATVIALWFKAAVYAVLVLQPEHRRDYGTLSGLRFDRPLLGRLLYFGGPSGLQMLLDVTGFTVFILLVGRLGAIEIEATTMAFSISSLAFMPVWGVGLAVSILVGQHLGEDRDADAARSGWTGLAIGCGYMAVISLLYVATPDLFLGGFLPAIGERTAHEAAVYTLAVKLLLFVAAYNLGDAMAMVSAGVLKGAGDTQYILAISIGMASTLGGLSWLAIEQWRLGIIGCWALITVWLWGLAAMLFGRFLIGRWRSMRVIEPIGDA
ncbi:MAG: MATE family efflux transporter, partial [Planctomycetota bacterium]